MYYYSSDYNIRNIPLNEEEKEKMKKIISIISQVREGDMFLSPFLNTRSLYDDKGMTYWLERRKSLRELIKDTNDSYIERKLTDWFESRIREINTLIYHNREERRQEFIKKLEGIFHKRIINHFFNELNSISKSLKERDVVVANLSKISRHSMETYENIIKKLPLKMTSSMKNYLNFDKVGHLWLKAPKPSNATEDNPVKMYLLSINPYDYYARKIKYTPKSFLLIEGNDKINKTFIKVNDIKIPTYSGEAKLITSLNGDWFVKEEPLLMF